MCTSIEARTMQGRPSPSLTALFVEGVGSVRAGNVYPKRHRFRCLGLSPCSLRRFARTTALLSAALSRVLQGNSGAHLAASKVRTVSQSPSQSEKETQKKLTNPVANSLFSIIILRQGTPPLTLRQLRKYMFLVLDIGQAQRDIHADFGCSC